MSRISPDFLDPSGGSAARRGARPVVSAVGSVYRAERQRRRRVTTASARRRGIRDDLTREQVGYDGWIHDSSGLSSGDGVAPSTALIRLRNPTTTPVLSRFR